jgi:tetratricopeptide (TPR) repeat protein
VDLDPTSPILIADFGRLYYFAGESDRAVELYKRALTLEPNHQIAAQYLNQIYRPEDIGDKEAVLVQLARAADAHDFGLPYINVDPLRLLTR